MYFSVWSRASSFEHCHRFTNSIQLVHHIIYSSRFSPVENIVSNLQCNYDRMCIAFDTDSGATLFYSFHRVFELMQPTLKRIILVWFMLYVYGSYMVLVLQLQTYTQLQAHIHDGNKPEDSKQSHRCHIDFGTFSGTRQ